MIWEQTDKLNREEKIDPDANPLTSFGRDDDFTNELIKAVCKTNYSESRYSKDSFNLQEYRKTAQGTGKVVTNTRLPTTKKIILFDNARKT
ncbi:hypothetical protein SYJ56_14300 [Algoriphagus sp. D3-2-R+10]|uniref:hypothetical protein n=1 Tax=Algoriphagus aurantiacus TaxID=3103948 RepID=UPI002B3B186F|nr:hypothetical protein [Algoriphagus sp. D3-2-R+10]MEB2776490.1 hypothetical protein [Algoriphagus sp. D3-2-R+10]